MAIVNTKQLIDCELEGRVRNYFWRKAPSQATTGGLWFDTSMSPGNPPAQYFIGGILTSTISNVFSGQQAKSGATATEIMEVQRQAKLNLGIIIAAATMLEQKCAYLRLYNLICLLYTSPSPRDDTMYLV